MQSLINGLLLGGLYVLVAMGFSLVFGVMNIINLSHGALIMLGAYFTYFYSVYLEIDPILTIPVTAVSLFLVGYFMHWSVLNRIPRAQTLMTLLATYGAQIVLINIMLLLWGGEFRSISSQYSGQALQVMTVRISLIKMLAFTISLTSVLVVAWFLRYTRWGRAIQATRMNVEAAKLMGVKTDRIYALTFGLGCGLAGITGALVGMVYAFSPIMGDSYTGKAFIVSVLGGLGDLRGAIVGGILLGLAETFGSAFIGASYQETIGLVILMIILLFRPRGITGKEYY